MSDQQTLPTPEVTYFFVIKCTTKDGEIFYIEVNTHTNTAEFFNPSGDTIPTYDRTFSRIIPNEMRYDVLSGLHFCRSPEEGLAILKATEAKFKTSFVLHRQRPIGQVLNLLLRPPAEIFSAPVVRPEKPEKAAKSA